MTEPYELLNERYEEITIALREAYKNRLSDEYIDKLIELYNKYFVALQLIDTNSDMDNSCLIIAKTGGKRGTRLSYTTLSNYRKKLISREKKFEFYG